MTAEVLYQVLAVMDDVTFIVEGDSRAEVLRCIELDKFINKTIVETRSGLIAHCRVVHNDGSSKVVVAIPVKISFPA